MTLMWFVLKVISLYFSVLTCFALLGFFFQWEFEKRTLIELCFFTLSLNESKWCHEQH